MDVSLNAELNPWTVRVKKALAIFVLIRGFRYRNKTEFARLVGVEASTVSSWLSGKRTGSRDYLHELNVEAFAELYDEYEDIINRGKILLASLHENAIKREYHAGIARKQRNART